MDSVIARDLTRRYRDGGLHDLSFSMSPGERVAIFGHAGSGKSLLLSLIAGKTQPDSGTLFILGDPAVGGACIGFASQIVPSRFRSTPRQHILASFAAAHVPAGQRPPRLAEALHAACLFDRADFPIRDLNHSALISLHIAAAIAHRPEIVVIDDLLRLLPADQQAGWWSYLDQRRQLDGATVIHATRDSAEAESAERVLLLDRGRALAFEKPAILIANCPGDEIVIETSDSESIQRTLRGIPQVQAISTRDGIRFFAPDGAAIAAHLFRHPDAGMRSVFVRPATLWDCIGQLRT